MWIPDSAAEIEAAARSANLRETASFDGKEALPPSSKNRDVATDVAAMTTEGGVIVYGLGEDDNKRLTILAPFDLAGAAERVDQIVQTSIMEVPFIETRPLYTDADSGIGYLVVVVPQSARAPHQVVVSDDRRFYGRGATGNRRLPEGEIARLYQRRQNWEQDRDELLRAAVKSSRFTADGGMIGFARPVLPDPAIWDRAVTSAGSRQELYDKLETAATEPQTASAYDPSFTSRSILTWYPRGADEVSLSTLREEQSPDDAPYAVEASVKVDGSVHFFSARAVAEDRSSGPTIQRMIMELIIAGNFAAFLAFVSTLYEVAGYHGHVDIGVFVNGLRGARSFMVRDDFRGWFTGQPYNAPEFRRTERVSAIELREPKVVVARMLRPLFELTSGQRDFNPFA